MTDNIAVQQGYTRAVVAYAASLELFLLVKPDVDFDEAFTAWDTDEQEFIQVNGWLFTYEEASYEPHPFAQD